MLRSLVKSIPNLLSWLRIVLGLAFPFVPASWRLPLVGVAAFTDLADGEASRWFHAQSEFGRILDPIADKIFGAIVAATLLFEGSIAWWVLVLIGLRDIIVAVGAGVVVLAEGWACWRSMVARPLGKVTTVLQFGFLLVVLLEARSLWPLWIPTAICSTASGVDYVLEYLRSARAKS